MRDHGQVGAGVASGSIKRDDRTIFMHTGGLPGLFGHPDFRP
jgi:L-cysteate sulfo-lyase